MGKKPKADKSSEKTAPAASNPKPAHAGKPSALLDTRVVYCGDCLEQLKNLPENCVDLIYIDPPFNSNRNYEVFWMGRAHTLAERSEAFIPRPASRRVAAKVRHGAASKPLSTASVQLAQSAKFWERTPLRDG
jgi:16S rRNA G966 N2-methylase RsmD